MGKVVAVKVDGGRNKDQTAVTRSGMAHVSDVVSWLGLSNRDGFHEALND